MDKNDNDKTKPVNELYHYDYILLPVYNYDINILYEKIFACKSTWLEIDRIRDNIVIDLTKRKDFLLDEIEYLINEINSLESMEVYRQFEVAYKNHIEKKLEEYRRNPPYKE